MKSITIAISGMSCGHCLNAVNQALSGVEGVSVGSVQIGRATLSLPDEEGSLERVRTAIEDAGYRVEGVLG